MEAPPCRRSRLVCRKTVQNGGRGRTGLLRALTGLEKKVEPGDDFLSKVRQSWVEERPELARYLFDRLESVFGEGTAVSFKRRRAPFSDVACHLVDLGHVMRDRQGRR